MAKQLEEALKRMKLSLGYPIGSGSFSSVFEVWDAEGKAFAVKLMQPNDSVTLEEATSRFEKEIRLQKELSKGNDSIVHVHDYEFGWNGCWFAVMELGNVYLHMPGLVSTHKNWILSDRFRVIREVGEAVSYAHKNGIVHRDIKPENVLFEKDANQVWIKSDSNVFYFIKGKAKITDFGMSEQVNLDGRLDSIADYSIRGTPEYMPPEQAEKPQVADPRNDIFSLGVMLYEVLSGESPREIDCGNVCKIAYSIMEAPIRPLQVMGGKKYQFFKHVLHKALELDPNKRYTSMQNFLDDLEECRLLYIGDEINPTY